MPFCPPLPGSPSLTLYIGSVFCPFAGGITVGRRLSSAGFSGVEGFVPHILPVTSVSIHLYPKDDRVCWPPQCL